jgi:hypothetical protein
MGKENKKKNKNKSKSPAPVAPLVNEKDLITEQNANAAKKLLEDLSKRYPEVKERVSLKQSKKDRLKRAGGRQSSNDSNTSTERKSRSRSKSNNEEQKPRQYREYSKKELKDMEYRWKPIDTAVNIPPSDYTITHINQNHDLLVN